MAATQATRTSPRTQRRAGRWIAATTILAVLAVGLGVWGLNQHSQLNTANADLEQARAQAASGHGGQGTLDALAGAVAGLVGKQIDPGQVQQALSTAKANVDQADQAVQQARTDAEKALAQARQATAGNALLKTCAEAVSGALNTVGQGSGGLQEQLARAATTLKGLSAQCKSAFAGG